MICICTEQVGVIEEDPSPVNTDESNEELCTRASMLVTQLYCMYIPVWYAESLCVEYALLCVYIYIYQDSCLHVKHER